MTSPLVEGYLTQPYVGIPEFKASPTWLDTNDLIAGGSQAQNDDELNNILLRASWWADNWCNQRLGAHSVVEQTRTRTDRYGRVVLHPSNVPVRQVTGVAYGSDFQLLTALSDLSQVWVEDARGIVISMVPNRGAFSTLEFGGIPSDGCEVYVQYSYIAGYASTVLSATVAQGATSITVADPTGLQPPATSLVGTIPGSTMRIWDAGQEEAVTIGNGYTVGSSAVPLASALANAHTVTAGPAGQIPVSEMPPDIHQAVISMAVALMLREDVSDEDPFGGTPYGPRLRQTERGGKAGGLLDYAYELLEPYRRVR
jgi:hypothetical protein